MARRVFGEVDHVCKLYLAAGLSAIGARVPAWMRDAADQCLADRTWRRRLVTHSVRQKMFPLVVHYLGKRAAELDDAAPAACEVIGIITGGMYDHLSAIVQRLRGRAPIMLLKGGDLLLTSYPPDVPRQMRDLDLLVRPEHLGLVRSALLEQGFLPGAFDRTKGRIVPFARGVEEYLATHHYELAPFSRAFEVQVTYERDQARAIQRLLAPAIDLIERDGKLVCAFEYDLHFNLSMDLALDDAWYRVRRKHLGDGVYVHVQAPSEKLWFLAGRLYHEAANRDATMRQWIDLLAVAWRHRTTIDWDRVLTIARRYGLHSSIYYTGWHANELLGDVVPWRVIDACAPPRNKRRNHDWGDFVPALFAKATIVGIAPGGSSMLRR